MKRIWLLIGGAVVLLVLILSKRHAGSKLPSGKVTPMLSLGYNHGLVLSPDGSIWSWGAQDTGSPVHGVRKKFSANLIRVGQDSDWASVSAGVNCNLALKSDGTMWAWGPGSQWADNYRRLWATNYSDAPVRAGLENDWLQVKAGSCAYALKKDHTLWSWGGSSHGESGTDSRESSQTPKQVGTATNWVKISPGWCCAAGLQSDGSLWTWGAEWGNPKFGSWVPTRVTTDTNWIDVSSALNVWLGVKSDGTLSAWGLIAHRFTGASRHMDNVPMRIGSDTDWASVWSSDDYHHFAKKRNGTFWSFDGVDEFHNSVKVTKLNLPSNVGAVDAGCGAIAVVTPDGEVWTCGAVIGRYKTTPEFIRAFERLCWRVGLNIQLSHQPLPVVREEPWQLRCLGQ